MLFQVMRMKYLTIIGLLALAVSFPVGIGTGLLPCPMLIERIQTDSSEDKNWKQIIRDVLFYLFHDEKI